MDFLFKSVFIAFLSLLPFLTFFKSIKKRATTALAGIDTLKDH